ncbi:putative aflatoxin b1-aldehyde [Diplodia seriata]|uniref:Putative aflatoxin b1-aldehyde n=1 Tax=Diplodia seriata TaxID=420778 RepID=A0A0G2FZA3_9PEZI|nr:putative aflatoxin b1-aldehyde [Diplodia seriata]
MPLVANTRPTPRVILGLMTFGPDESTGARVTSLDEYNKVLDHFQSQGYNEVDTARTYVGGRQESFTASAKWRDRGLTLATKCYPREAGTHQAARITESVEKSLAELQTDCVDIFYLHAADRSVPFAETLEAVNKLHKQGKFVQLGLSNFTAFEVAEVVMTCKYNGWVRPTIYQAMYNAITRSIEAELIPACRRYGLDIVVYNPIAGGLFSGKYKSSEVPTTGRFSDSVGRMGDMYRARYFKDATWEALPFRWLTHHSALSISDGGNDGVIIGVSSLEQLQQNLKEFEKGPLPDEVLKALDEAWLVAKPTTPNYWHLDLKYTYDTRKALFG